MRGAAPTTSSATPCAAQLRAGRSPFEAGRTLGVVRTTVPNLYRLAPAQTDGVPREERIEDRSVSE